MIAFDHMQTEIPEGDHYEVTVIGIGGAGSNVIDRLALDGMGEAEIVCMNTDIRSLSNSMANRKVQLGRDVTKGLGAGGDPELGLEVAEASADEIRDVVRGRDIIFICAGLGGGTGSGAAPYVAQLAREAGAFVVVFAIMPFGFEGRRRRAQADEALERLAVAASALLTFENGRMGELVLPKEGIQAAFAAADEVIGQSVRAVTGIVLRPGLIRIGMDDLIRALENDDSRCLFGYGEATGESRAQEALTAALRSPLLERGVLLSRSRNVLVHVTGGKTMTLIEVELLMTELGKQIGDEAQILFGTGHDPKLGDRLAVTVISSLAQVIEAPPEKKRETGRTEEREEEVIAAVEEVVEDEPVEEAVLDVVEEVVVEEVVVEEEVVAVVEVEVPVVERATKPSGELELGEIASSRAPKVARSVASAAMAEIEEVVAETLLDLGMEEPVAEVKVEEEMLERDGEFVSIEEEEMEAAAPIGVETASSAVVGDVGEVEGAPGEKVDAGSDEAPVAAEANVTGAPEPGEGEMESSGDRLVEAQAPAAVPGVEAGGEAVEEVEVAGEVEGPGIAASAGSAEVVAGDGAAPVGAPGEGGEAVVGEVETEAEMDEEATEVAACEVGVEEDEAGIEESLVTAARVDDDVATGGDALEDEAITAEQVAAKIEAIAAAMVGPDEEPVAEASVSEVAAVERSEVVSGVVVDEVSEEPDVAFADEEATVVDDEVEEEVVAEAVAPVEEEPEEEPNYYLPAEEVVLHRDEPEPEEEEEEEEEPVGVAGRDGEGEIDEDVEEAYVPSPGYGRSDDEEVEAYGEAEAEVEDEDEPVLAMAGDSGHTNPAAAKAVGPRVGLVEPKPSDPSGQGMLELDPGSRGRFDNSSPTVIDGEDLDVPTFLRKRKQK